MDKLIVANWKMSPQTLQEAEAILDRIKDYLSPSLVICPPFIFIEEIAKLIGGASLGAQDIFWDDVGADTGEVSGPMLKKLGVRYVIVGHSERRWKFGETNDVVNKKLKAVLRNGLVPIVCIGEKDRNQNFKNFLENQVNKTFDGLSADEIGKCMVAYEPVWAISSNPDAKPDTPQSAFESIKIIRDALIVNCKLKIENLPKALYGGSVTSKNVADFLSQDEIDGVLVGSASVNKEEFVKILSLI